MTHKVTILFRSWLKIKKTFFVHFFCLFYQEKCYFIKYMLVISILLSLTTCIQGLRTSKNILVENPQNLLSNFSVDTDELTLLDFHSVQKMKFSIKNFFSKCDEISSFPQTWSHLWEKSLREIFIFLSCQFLAER